MPENAQLLNIAALHFEIAEAHLKDTEDMLCALNERLEDIRGPITKYVQDALPSIESLEKFVHDRYPMESPDEEFAHHNLEGRLEENLTSLLKIWSSEFVYNSSPVESVKL